MNFNAKKLKKIFFNALRGQKKSNSENRSNVYWEAVLEEERGDVFEERRSFEPVGSFPEELTEQTQFITRIPVYGENVQVTRASVYVGEEEEDERSGGSGGGEEGFSGGFRTVRSSSRLVDMETGVVTFSESESSHEEGSCLAEAGLGPSNVGKLCYGPELSVKISPAPRGASALSTFVRDVENELQGRPKAGTRTGDWSCSQDWNSSNSLDIEKELNELMGVLCTGIQGGEGSGFREEDEKFPSTGGREAGSQINLAFVSTEPETRLPPTHAQPLVPQVDDYWRGQRAKSKSFAERHKLGKLLRKSRERMSMIEIGSRGSRRSDCERDSDADGDSTALVFEPKQPPFLRLAYERSSVMEPKVTSTVSLPQRPQSALEDRRMSACSSSGRRNAADGSVSSACSQQRESLARGSEGVDEWIDWSWLEEAMRSLSSEPPGPVPASQRVDAGCQTQPEQSWEGEEERMRSGAPSRRVSDAASIGVTSECRVVERGGCDEDMPCKAFAEGSGASGVSSWLRQSMRRVRHFNLEDPPRIRSAPPDSLRVQIESDHRGETESDHGAGNDDSEVVQQSQRQRTDEAPRTQRRDPTRPRPSSTPARRPPPETTPHHHQTDSDVPTPPSEAQENFGYESDSTDRHPSPRRRRRRDADDETEEPEGRSPLGPWPHALSSVFAGLGCTLGLFNISRFAVLSVHFGSNFILQFLLLSLLLGVPLLAFHAALGQTLAAGPVDMWRISPLFQGIGIALLLAQALIGMYSIVGVSWMFVYFRDSFINKQDAFRWAESFRHYREDNIFAASILNASGRLEETVPDYLNGVVLQRYGLTSPENAFGHLKFQLTFNLAVVWMIVFVSLSKGLRSYGKVVYVFSVVPVLGVLVMCSKLLGLTPLHRGFFPQTDWSEFFLNPKSWISAATEVMLTWNLLGAATMQVTSHNRTTKRLWRDLAAIALITLLVLLLAAFLGNMCHQLISLRGYSYVPSSFERISTYSFLRPATAPLPPAYTIPLSHMAHASLVAGERVAKPGAIHESGYQVIRLATELVPATLAILDGDFLSPFWAVLFYFTMILFGIAQQLAIWHCVITGIMAINAPSLKSWETTITFFTCAAGFVLGLPMTTELGIFVVYFLDYCLGGGWWVILLTLLQLCAVLMVRGRPYSGENISIALFGKPNNCISLWAVPLLTFAWNVIAPVSLLVVCITIFKNGGYRDLWTWKCGNADYWPLWTRQVGVFVQIIPILCIPVVAVIQCYRYLSKGPADIFDRLANLYRPPGGIHGVTDEDGTATSTNISSTTPGTNPTADIPPAEDPPPKYTPPPSYSTATGTRIAKLLRQSFRRSVRRIQSVLGPDLVQPPRPPPPDYASVLVEMNQNQGRQEDRNASHPPEGYTAADVVQVLRCSFRRTNQTNAQPSHDRGGAAPQNLVIPPRWDQ